MLLVQVPLIKHHANQSNRYLSNTNFLFFVFLLYDIKMIGFL